MFILYEPISMNINMNMNKYDGFTILLPNKSIERGGHYYTHDVRVNIQEYSDDFIIFVAISNKTKKYIFLLP